MSNSRPDMGGRYVTSMRRTARELALKALYQIDVGKGSVAEVLDGALDQIRQSLVAPMTQIVRESDVALREMVPPRVPGAPVPSERAARAARQFAKAAGEEIRLAAERAVEIARLCVSDRPTLDDATASEQMREVVRGSLSALQRLHERGFSAGETMDAILAEARNRLDHAADVFSRLLPAAVMPARFVTALTVGVVKHRKTIDRRLAALATDWSLDRQAAVDRNILRLAAFEILYEPDIPAAASINEAVELAKKYSTADSGRFVNGILGTLVTEVRSQEKAAVTVVSEPAVPSVDGTRDNVS